MFSELSSSTIPYLKDFVRRINNIKDENEKLSIDLKEIYKEISDAGFDARIVKAVVKELRMDKNEKIEKEKNEEMFHVYMSAIKGGLDE
ncbi:GapR family DNA-binding domain-containing protein [Candidatus Gromoviella agglomerans]|uniref:GapR family DNA-binding domain-containing protein n=1 Tax=Candidatus Gromoviella agglomerans TaxID=2806609 RepID=UPI001E635585|nr:GapR family DNA-binding domain-containing protein [Candidatus Gromoviella agglomerans]UFX98586.1 DUF2312 domain-containing protein [Candidatus Gromoviella agglomerans]